MIDQEAAAKEAEEAARREEEMIAERKLASKELAGETIRRELAESKFSPRPRSALSRLEQRLTKSQGKRLNSFPMWTIPTV